jgi:hypothetical protein
MSWMDDAKARCEAATAGPWVRDSDWWVLREEDRGKDVNAFDEDNDPPQVVPVVGMWIEDRELRVTREDADFIAHARTDLPRALALIDEMAACLRMTVRVGSVHVYPCRWEDRVTIPDHDVGCTCHVAKVRAVLTKVAE